MAAPAAAQEPVELQEIVLSGGLTPVPDAALGRASTVLTEEEIERQNERYAADVRRTVPGLNASRIGSFGGLTQLRIRGHEGNHTLVLIDGVEVNTVNQGEYDFGGLLSEDIERIEMLRGPQSSIYGSNAIGGVVSITTKRAREPGLSATVGADAGTDGTLGGLAAVRQGFEGGGINFSLARRATGGFDVSGDGGLKDGDLNTTLNLAGDYEVAPGFRVGGTLRRVERKSDLDRFVFGAPTAEGLVVDDPGSFAEVDELFGSLFAEADSLGGRLVSRLAVTYAEADRVSFGGFAPTADNSGDRRGLSYVGTLALDAPTVAAARQTLSLAVSHERERYRENDPAIVFGPGQLEERRRSQTGYVLEDQGRFDTGFDVQGSVRFDRNDAFEDFTTYALGLSYALPNGTTRLHASAGTGVQNPTLIEQFGFASNFQGNPDLEPEQSRGFDLGVEQAFAGGAGLVDVTYFREELTDNIGSEVVAATGLARPVNQEGTSDRQGVEVTARYSFSPAVEASLAYTYLDATEPVPDGAGGTRDAVEVRRPEHEIYLQGTYRLPNDRTSVTVEIRHVSGLFDLDFKTFDFSSSDAAANFDRVRLDDHTLVDLSFRHRIDDRIPLTGSVTNLLDREYEELEGYATPGREAFLGVVASF